MRHALLLPQPAQTPLLRVIPESFSLLTATLPGNCALPPSSILSEQIPLAIDTVLLPSSVPLYAAQQQKLQLTAVALLRSPSRPSSLSQQGTVILLSDSCPRHEQVRETLAQLCRVLLTLSALCTVST